MLVCAVLTVLLGARRGDAAHAERELREDDPAQPPVHPELPGEPRASCAAWATRCASSSRTRTATSTTRSTSTRCKKINDELFLTPGVDRAWVKSLWAPAVRWTEVTEEGFRGGPVMPDNYDGSPPATEQLRANIARAGIVGSLVGNDFKSSMIVVPLLDQDPTTGQRIDYRALSHAHRDRSAPSTRPTRRRRACT